jgi:formylglycine-generating enzyme required for sulfatase activity
MLLLVNGKLAAKALLLAATPVALAAVGHDWRAPAPDPVAVVHVQPGQFDYRVAGAFDRGGRPVNAPVRSWNVGHGLAVMKTQVSAADYDRCVGDGACDPRGGRKAGRADLPAVGVSWQDATAYARWFSGRTGQAWRLPTDAEWAYVAGSRFRDDAVQGDDGTDSFARRWLAKYDEESATPAAQKAARPAGSFGENERGVADLAGNVWEWTDTCYLRQGLDAAGEATGSRTVNCGVRVVEGAHRSYVTDFIRDARAGGCAVGTPPANLGFRLVREEVGPVRRVIARAQALVAVR